MLSPGRKGQGREIYPGGEVFVSQFCPLPGTQGQPRWPSAPDYKLLWPLFQLSQFPFSTCQGIFPPYHYPVSLLSAETWPIMNQTKASVTAVSGARQGVQERWLGDRGGQGGAGSCRA